VVSNNRLKCQRGRDGLVHRILLLCNTCTHGRDAPAQNLGCECGLLDAKFHIQGLSFSITIKFWGVNAELWGVDAEFWGVNEGENPSLVAFEGPVEHDLAGILVLPNPYLVRRPSSGQDLQQSSVRV
jgi:hypothetical protein